MAKLLWSKGALELWRVDMFYGGPSFHIFIGSRQVLFTFDGQEAIDTIKLIRALIV